MNKIDKIKDLLEKNGYEEVGLCIADDSYLVYDKVFTGGSMTTIRIYNDKLIVESANRLGEIRGIKKVSYETFILCSEYYLN